MYLLDTCVFSELTKKEPSKSVIKWLLEREEGLFYVSALSFGEIKKGIEKVSESKKKEKLENWFQDFLLPRFWHKIITLDGKVANEWGQLMAQVEMKGRSLPVIDSLIAATALAHQLKIVTRKTKDFDGLQIPIINPWMDLD